MTSLPTSMPVHRPLLLAALLGPGLAILSVAAMMLAALGSRWGFWHFPTGFMGLRWAVYAAVAAAVISLLGAIVTRPGTGRRGFVLAMLGLVVAVAAVLLPWKKMREARSLPPIHDITTDAENPPLFVAVLPRRTNAANPAEYGGAEVAAQQRAAYPDIVPLSLGIPMPAAFQRALAAARDLGWEIVASDSAQGRIEATDRTFWFGFYDDVVVRITPVGTGSRIDARSVSRVGKGDVGANSRRIREFLARVERER